MSGIDVRDLAKESLASDTFPVDSRTDFRLYFAPKVRQGIEQHAKADISVEICGVLVGHWGTDENGPFAAVTDYIRCEQASSKFAEVTFTHEAWAQINKEMDSRFADKRIVGWYHSHPDFGIFLSERDCFIHEHFFSGPGQVAYVVDPVRDLEGVFVWRSGKPQLLAHYWIGDTIHTAEASRRPASAESYGGTAAMTPTVSQNPPSVLRDLSAWNLATLALGLLTLFLLGYLYGGWRTDWDRMMMIQGAVAHFANAKVIRAGLENDLAAVQSRLTALITELDKFNDAGNPTSSEQVKEAAARRKMIRDNLILCRTKLAEIERNYGLSHEERMILAQIVAQKQAELMRAIDSLQSQSADREKREMQLREERVPPQPGLGREDPPQQTPSKNPPTSETE